MQYQLIPIPGDGNCLFNAAEALMHAELKSTTLIGWLNLNNHKQSKSPCSYPETPMHYV